MKLTPENKAKIDGMSMMSLLERIRYSPFGDPWFQDETGDYWMKRYAELRAKNPDEAVTASKTLGWDK